MILILRGGVPRTIGNLPESLSQAISVGTFREIGRTGKGPHPEELDAAHLEHGEASAGVLLSRCVVA